MSSTRRLLGAALTVAALTTFSGVGVAAAAPSAPILPMADCASPAALTILGFNDFHGRIAAAQPNTLAFVTQIETERAASGEANTLLLSSGDNIGATLFTSFIQNDQPTIDLLNAMDVEVSTVGNHEFDQGWPDLRDRVISGGTNAEFPYLAANVYTTGTTTPVLPAYKIFEKAGLKVAVVGAVTGDLMSLVSPAGMTGLQVGDPVQAVNRTIGELKDGNPANGEADVVIVSYHEGGPSGDLATNNANATFTRMVTQTDARAQAIFNGHTHQTYAYDIDGRMVMQAGSYASGVAKVKLNVDPTTGETCSTEGLVLPITATPDTTLPRVQTAQGIINGAITKASELGAEVIGSASAPISRAMVNPTTDDRLRESTMSNMVAQMFAETLGNGDPNFIGIQNPGGTRADFDTGDITYSEAAAILPFANTLMTTKITGAQFKTVLEQQWQRDAEGNVPSRAFLQLGLSDNVSFTYDESLAEGSRITSITVNGKPIDPAATYTVGSGSFLISGGDNFRELAKGTSATDTGRADLESFVAWVKAKRTVSPDFAKRAVSVHTAPAELELDVAAAPFAVGVPQGAKIALDTLDFKTAGVVNTSLNATINGVQVGTAPITDGQVSDLTVTLNQQALNAWLATKPSSTQAMLTLTAESSKTIVQLPVKLKYSISVTATSAGTKPAGHATNVWGTVTGASGAPIAVQVLVNGKWSTSQIGTVRADGQYVLPLTYGATTIGTQTFRTVVTTPAGYVVSPQFTLERTIPQVTVRSTTAGTKPVGQASNVWGTATDAAGAKIHVQVLVNGRWSTSQIGTVAANGSYVVPLTYGINTLGTTRYRTVVVNRYSTTVGPEFTLTRTAPSVTVTANTAGTKPVGQTTYVWGSATNAAGARVTLQAVVNRAWSTSQIGTVAANGTYRLPLTYGITTPGTYTFRVVVTTPYGSFVSSQFTLTRT